MAEDNAEDESGSSTAKVVAVLLIAIIFAVAGFAIVKPDATERFVSNVKVFFTPAYQETALRPTKPQEMAMTICFRPPTDDVSKETDALFEKGRADIATRHGVEIDLIFDPPATSTARPEKVCGLDRRTASYTRAGYILHVSSLTRQVRLQRVIVVDGRITLQDIDVYSPITR